MPESEVTVADLDGSHPALLLHRALGTLRDEHPDAIDLGKVFAAAGYELSLVGGPVRDAILGRPVVDLDFATSALPDETERLLAAWGDTHWAIGKEFGTIGAQRHARGDQAAVTVEVTTYRSDEYDLDSRKPQVAFGDSLDGDLSRRDFTVNAMAVRVPDLTFVDPFGGLTDLSGKLLRTPVAPEQSFADDPLRMMRAARFVSQLGFDIEPATAAAMRAMAGRIEIVSAERVRDEFVKLMLGAFPRRGLSVFAESGLSNYVLPELPALRLEVDEHHHHKDVYEHTLTVVDQAIALETGDDGPVPRPDLVLRLAALLHDIGKPATRRFEPGGGVSFHHHELVGARMTSKRMKALRFDKETTKAVARLVELHLRFHGYGTGEWTDSAVRRYVTDAGPLLQRLHRLTRADCTTRNRRRAAKLSASYDDLEARIDELAQKEELAAIRPDLSGDDIMTILGIKPGPLVGQAYKYLLEVRMNEGPLAREDAEARLREWWAARESATSAS